MTVSNIAVYYGWMQYSVYCTMLSLQNTASGRFMISLPDLTSYYQAFFLLGLIGFLVLAVAIPLLSGRLDLLH